MTLQIAFEISSRVGEVTQYTSSDASTAKPCLHVQIWPTFNRTRIHGGAQVFDALSVLARGAEPSDFDPFTCTCGVAGCAGFEDPVTLSVDGGDILWTFPEDPFRKNLPVSLFPADQPLVARFAKTQYLATLYRLELDLAALESSRGLPLVFSTDDRPDLSQPFLSLMGHYRERLGEWLAQDRARTDLYGPLLEEEIAAEFEDGSLYSIWPSSVLFLLFERDERNDQILGRQEDSDRKALKENRVKSFIRDRSLLADALRELPWSEVSDCAYLDNQTMMFSIIAARTASETESLWKTAKISTRPAV